MNLVELQTSESLRSAVMASRETVYQCFGRAAELAHRFFPDHGLSMLSDDGRLQMVAELMDISGTLQRAYQLAGDVAFALIRDVQQLGQTSDISPVSKAVALSAL
jgi:hypothetical protein